MPLRVSTVPTPKTTLVAVSYRASVVQVSRPAVVGRELALGASYVQEYQFPHIGHVVRILSVTAQRAPSVEASLRLQPGVLAVGAAGLKRSLDSVSAPFFPNDPYFTGFSTTLPPAPGATAPPPTFEVGPLEESADVPGQWDMHVVQLEHAFAYSQSGNGSGVSSPNALGSSAVKVAIIDSGVDTTHPELTGKVAYQKCFITNPSGTQSSSSFAVDQYGHGTDVAGIAAAAINNGFGFAGDGGNVSIYGYRVFPTPDDSCASDATSDEQCFAADQDIASAINDAVAQHVNVINLSLGAGACGSGGVDPSTIEGDAIAEAIAANIVVVASAGNSGSPGKPVALQAPSCDKGVIAVGATGLADGQPNGAGNSDGTAGSPFEYLASYSNAGSPGAAVNSSSAWGIVAPGGDPASTSDLDNLHWVQNIWTSTPFQSSPSDQTFLGSCTDDYPNLSKTTPPVDCTTFIAGTSMSAPHVAGAAGLLLSVSAAYQSPNAMKQLLCSTADDIHDANEGCGRLNVYRAMAAALADPHLPPSSGTP